MTKKRRYYRTAALLGPTEQQVPVRRRTARARAARTGSAAGRSAGQRNAGARGARTRTSMPAIRIPWKMVLSAVALVVAVLWVVLGDPWYLMWEDLTVTGNSYPQLEQMMKVTTDLLGYHRFRLQPREAEQLLGDALPHVADVDIQCDIFPTSCEIKIKERVPVLIWVEGTTAYWVDDTGVAFPALLERPDLPVIRGALPEPDSPYTLAAILQGITALGELGIPLSELECTRERGLVWMDPEGRRVTFGAGTGMSERWQTYQLLVGHFAGTGIPVQHLDVRFRDGITYTSGRSW
jgi:hypothetical protein